MEFYEHESDDRAAYHDDVKCTHKTEKALLCVIDGEDIWIPKSQVHDLSEVYDVGHEGTLVVSLWLAEQNSWC